LAMAVAVAVATSASNPSREHLGAGSRRGRPGHHAEALRSSPKSGRKGGTSGLHGRRKTPESTQHAEGYDSSATTQVQHEESSRGEGIICAVVDLWLGL
jgi:hypothetical protein